MAVYDIEHDTTYRYDSAVLLSQQIAHLRPRERAGQHTLAHRLEIEPVPAELGERSDFFGQPGDRLRALCTACAARRAGVQPHPGRAAGLA